jgi:hypothetical protein
MAKTNDIIAEIAAAVPQRQFLRWHQRVAPEHAATLAAIREAYFAGKFGKARRPAVEAIVKVLAARGIANVGRNGIETWLSK